MRDHGMWVPLDRHHPLQAGTDASLVGKIKQDADPYRIWLNGTEITEREWMYWMRIRQHIQLNEPDAVDSDPHKKIDLRKARPILPPPQEQI